MNKPIFFALGIALSWMAMMPTAHSQFSSDPGALQKTFDNTEHKAEVERLILKDEKRISPDCSDIVIGKQADFFVLTPIEFDDMSTRPVSGAWVEIWDIAVCGTDKRRSVGFGVRNGNLRGTNYIPGHTGADPRLVRDILRPAAMTVLIDVNRKHGIECRENPALLDTQITAPIARLELGDYIMRWGEQWSYRACGHDVELSIEFLTKRVGGTTYNIEIKDAE